MMEAATERLDEVIEEFVPWYFESHPVRASQLGVHDYDARYPAMSRNGIQDRIDELLRWLSELDGIRFDHLEAEHRARYATLEYAIRSELLDLEEIRRWARDPRLYVSVIAAGLEAVARGDAVAPEDRLGALGGRLDAAPALLTAARENVTAPPRLWTELAIDEARRLAAALDDGMLSEPGPGAVGGAAAALEASRARLIDDLESYAGWLQSDLLPRSNGDFRLGRYLFERKLLHAEHVSLDIEDLERLNQAAIDEYDRWVTQVAAEIDSTRSAGAIMDSIIRVHPGPDRLVDAARERLDEVRDWTTEAGVVALPDADPIVVRAGPSHERFRFAWLDTPGSFEEEPAAAVYRIATPGPDWSDEERQEYLTYFNTAELASITLDRTYPGRAVQAAYERQVESPIVRMFVPRTLIDGWGHYAEQMALDSGYGADDPAIRLTQLRRALQRHARWYAVVALHARGAEIDDVVDRFMEISYASELPARRQVMRASWDPLYLSSALGRMQIVELRKDVRERIEEEGEETFALAAFHEQLLELALPLPLARDIMIPLREERAGPRRRR
jgi:uncharacterized protein (DUF885 family)